MGTFKRVEYRGEMLTLRELACLTGIDESTIRHSIRDGRSAEDAIECIKRRRVTYDVGGETLTLRQIAKRAGSISVDKVMQRIDAGETPEEIMESYQMIRLRWPEKAFAMLYPAEEREDMRFRELSAGNWGWQSEFFCYMASRLGTQCMLLRAWWRESGEAAMLRLYWLKERDDADDELTEIVDTRMKGRILRKAGLVG